MLEIFLLGRRVSCSSVRFACCVFLTGFLLNAASFLPKFESYLSQRGLAAAPVLRGSTFIRSSVEQRGTSHPVSDRCDTCSRRSQPLCPFRRALRHLVRRFEPLCPLRQDARSARTPRTEFQQWRSSAGLEPCQILNIGAQGLNDGAFYFALPSPS